MKEIFTPWKVRKSKCGALIFLLCALLPAPLLAHGGAGFPHLNNVPAGPFRVFVWSDPEPHLVGEYHLTIALTENVEGDTTGLAGLPILDAFVIVEIVHQESGESLSARATHENALNRLFYEASFAPSKQGIWSVQVRIAPPGCGPEGENGSQDSGSSSASCQEEQALGFEEELLPKPFPWNALLGALLSIVFLLGAGLLYWKTLPPVASRESVRAKEFVPAPAGEDR